MIVPSFVLPSSFPFPTENDSWKFFKIRCEYFLPKTDEERLARSLWASRAAVLPPWASVSTLDLEVASHQTSRAWQQVVAAKPEPLQLLVLEASLAALAKKAAPLPTGGIKSTKAWYDFRAPEGQTPPSWTCQKITPLLPTFSQASTHLGWLWIIGHSELVSFFHGHHYQ